MKYKTAFISSQGRKNKIRVPKELRDIEKKPRINKSKRKPNKLWVNLRGWALVDKDYKCELCGDNATYVHHIKSVNEYPELQLNKNNLIVLCSGCHKKMHPELPNKLFSLAIKTNL